MDYKDAGVDVEKGDLFVERIQGMIKETYDARVVSDSPRFTRSTKSACLPLAPMAWVQK